MKTFLFSLLTLFSAAVYGQFGAGTKELALSFSASKHSYESEGSYGNPEDVSMLYLSLTPAYYLAQGLAIEPEVSLALNNESKPGQCVIMNLGYTGKIENSSAAFFVRLGYGLSNGVYYPMLRGPLTRTSKEFDIGILNFGTGLKLLLGENVYIRAEANYKRQTYERDVYSFTYPTYYYTTKKTKTTLSDIAITAGLGVLF